MINSLKGVAEMRAKLRALAAQYPDRIAKALYMRGQEVMTEAKRRCPVASDGGTLRASGQVAQPERVGRRVTVTLSFGGAAMAYAIAVHETPSEHDPPSWRMMYRDGGQVQWTSAGTGSHFLSGPIQEAQATLAADLAKDLSIER